MLTKLMGSLHRVFNKESSQMEAKVKLETYVKERGKRHAGDNIEIDGGLQAVFDHLRTLDWDGEFQRGFEKNRIEQFIAKATVNGVKVVIGLTPAGGK